MLERAYDLAKRYGWPHFFVPLFLLVLIDYIHILLHFVTVALLAYVSFQSFGFVFGCIIGMMLKLRAFRKPDEVDVASVWADVLNYRVASLVPTIGWGCKFFNWILTEQEQAKLEE
jgi:amino acid transporter